VSRVPCLVFRDADNRRRRRGCESARAGVSPRPIGFVRWGRALTGGPENRGLGSRQGWSLAPRGDRVCSRVLGGAWPAMADSVRWGDLVASIASSFGQSGSRGLAGFATLLGRCGPTRRWRSGLGGWALHAVGWTKENPRTPKAGTALRALAVSAGAVKNWGLYQAPPSEVHCPQGFQAARRGLSPFFPAPVFPARGLGAV